MEREFGVIADLIRLHAQEAPSRTALADSQRTLDYGALDALMDRIAASLQRDGLRAGDAIAICAASSTHYAALFLGALRAGIAVAPLAPGSTPASLARMIEDAQARLLFLDAAAAEVIGAPAKDAIPRIALDGSAAGQRLRGLAGAGGRAPASRRAAARLALQHHLFLRHHRRAQGHRAGPRHALGPRAARREVRLRARHRHAAVDAAVLQHHAGGLLPHPRLRRLRAADAEVRRRRLPGAGRAASRDPHDAGAGAVPAPDGAPGLRPRTTSPASASSSAPALPSAPRSRPMC